MGQFEQVFEQFKVAGKDLGDKIRELIHEGNVRRIIIKDEHGHTFLEIPLTVATIGVVAAPILAAVGAIATVLSPSSSRHRSFQVFLTSQLGQVSSAQRAIFKTAM